jgi:hypothetical protein
MADQLKPTDGKAISKKDAKRWIDAYKSKNPDQVWAQFYGCDHLNAILKQPGCVGIRIYITTGDGDKNQLVLVGARADGSNIWPKGESSEPDQEAIILDGGIPCPPVCQKE